MTATARARAAAIAIILVNAALSGACSRDDSPSGPSRSDGTAQTGANTDSRIAIPLADSRTPASTRELPDFTALVDHYGDAVVNVSETTDGGCDLCPSSKAQLVAQQAALSECCASKAACESEMACDSEGAAGTTKTVAHESGAASECGGKACKEGKDGCTGDGKNGCCGNCSEKKAEKSESMATSGR